jgi:hypothetical protein
VGDGSLETEKTEGEMNGQHVLLECSILETEIILS